MYTLISAIGKAVDGNGRWADIDIGNLALSTLFATYSRAYAVLSNPFIDHNVSLDLNKIRSQYAGQTLTFNQMLTNLGNSSLPTDDTIPVIDTRYVKYADAFHAGYKVLPVKADVSIDAELPLSEKTSLYLSRPETDFNLLYRSALVSVNGFIHRTDTNGVGLYVKDGMKSKFISGENQIGICSFRELGALSFVSITPDMIYKQRVDQRMRDRAYVNLGQDVSNKTVMLVLGGYLHVLDKRSFYRVGASQICIDFGNIPMFERYYESKRYIDLSGLPIEHTDRNPEQIAVDDFLSDANLTAYLTLSQSFFVILDNPEIFYSTQYVRASKTLGSYISAVKPMYPLIVGRGRMMNYWYTYEDTLYSLGCKDNVLDNPVYNTVNPFVQNSISDQRVPTKAASISPAMFLMVGRDI